MLVKVHVGFVSQILVGRQGRGREEERGGV